MKIKSIGDFEAAIDKDFQWRKHEITTIKLALKSARAHQVDVYFRSGVVLLYAHWEGLVKFSAKAYLSYVNNQGCCYHLMQPNFLFFAVKESLENSGKVNLSNYSLFEKTQDFFTTSNTQKFCVNADLHISTKENQNLTSAEFKAIVCKLGLRYLTLYELKEKLIDNQLLKYRNKVAHGESLRDEISDPLDTFTTLTDKVLENLESLCSQLRQAAQGKNFLKPAA
ncbi:MAE_28990/MAE_18760 family HEPN-like nuclease [Prosthecobacter dejongeii]|uniref:MAE-28990/MAE-18760-like HEPN domain-containing protein n=1 Tax=Prosthecobacter dejongeii TaxID=48465 RepID=A0A7W8DNY8_9BACT|nr:MAE_28990/MAE_18760 family HEPN-like nuclease [Prosthecobacter dejongeii]MBB5036426.1 hypothetical protein [Prosthecobacter dejongeii]